MPKFMRRAIAIISRFTRRSPHSTVRNSGNRFGWCCLRGQEIAADVEPANQFEETVRFEKSHKRLTGFGFELVSVELRSLVEQVSIIKAAIR